MDEFVRVRVRCLVLAAFVALLMVPAFSLAQHRATVGDVPGSESGDPPEVPEKVRASIKLAQNWLRNQQMADGSWPGGSGPSALATLALMVDGSVPGAGPYGREVAMGVRYLLSCQKPSGLIGVPNSRGGIMYHHGLATLCLAEVWGMSAEPEVRQALKKAALLIIRTQNGAGGWRYHPRPDDADLSVTVMQLVALRASQNAGIAVPENTIKDAIGYVKTCFSPGQAGFSYQPSSGGSSVPRAGAGMLSLQMCGLYDVPEVKKTCRQLRESASELEEDRFYFYGQYYVMQAMYQTRDTDAWNAWYDKACRSLMSRQDKNLGGFGGGVYETGMAVLALGLPYRYLPVYQR